MLRIHAHCVVTPACKCEVDIAKSWMFASSSPLLASLAGSCPHPTDSHASIAGIRESFAGFVSQQSAVYPSKPAAAYACACACLLSTPEPCQSPVSLPSAPALIPCKEKVGPRRLQDLRVKLHAWLLQAKGPSRLNALLQGQELDALFCTEEINHARSLFNAWMLQKGCAAPISWDIPDGQPYALHALSALSGCLQDKGSALFPALLSGAPVVASCPRRLLSMPLLWTWQYARVIGREQSRIQQACRNSFNLRKTQALCVSSRLWR